jgi:alpha-tubulin suppressor-like RCC1 family protein
VGQRHGATLCALGHVFGREWNVTHSWRRYQQQDGKLGQGDNESHFAPVLVRALEDKGIKSIQCGYDFAAAINVEGHLFTCTLPPAATTLLVPSIAPASLTCLLFSQGATG